VQSNYTCNADLGTCAINATGTPQTMAQCDGSCVLNKYTCLGDEGKCVMDPAGTQNSTECDDSCVQNKYTCVGDEGKCVLDTAGMQNRTECTASCFNPCGVPSGGSDTFNADTGSLCGEPPLPACEPQNAQVTSCGALGHGALASITGTFPETAGLAAAAMFQIYVPDLTAFVANARSGGTWGAQASVSVQRAPIAVAVLRRHGLERGQYQEGHSILKLRRPKTAMPIVTDEGGDIQKT
jgi:hypothetical protein